MATISPRVYMGGAEGFFEAEDAFAFMIRFDRLVFILSIYSAGVLKNLNLFFVRRFGV